jgi:hypothetical protein
MTFNLKYKLTYAIILLLAMNLVVVAVSFALGRMPGYLHNAVLVNIVAILQIYFAFKRETMYLLEQTKEKTEINYRNGLILFGLLLAWGLLVSLFNPFH